MKKLESILRKFKSLIVDILITGAVIDVVEEETASNWDPDRLIRTITTICVPLVFGLIVFVGIFGNALVIIGSWNNSICAGVASQK